MLWKIAQTIRSHVYKEVRGKTCNLTALLLDSTVLRESAYEGSLRTLLDGAVCSFPTQLIKWFVEFSHGYPASSLSQGIHCSLDNL